MKIFTSIGLASIAAVLVSCSAPSEPAPVTSAAKDYFFPANTTQIYTYSEDHGSSSDTVAYAVNPVDGSFDTYLKLEKQNPTTPGSGVLYYFKNKTNFDGQVVCVLSNSATSTGFVALKGAMDLDANWYCDTAQNILATIVGKYAEYFLPGREVHYHDVIVVKYTDKTAPQVNYVVRYFARDYGLIFERKITGQTSETTDLQLLSRQQATNSVNPDPHHDHWYDANGRYSANMKYSLEDEPYKK
ncbi:MAG: hypothetical protein ABI778_03370 [Ignavibacteriota bacterium]